MNDSFRQPLWNPTAQEIGSTNLTAYSNWLGREKGLKFDGYPALWKWSVENIEPFWNSIAEYYQVHFNQPPKATLSSREMPGVRWFPGATLNYAAHALREARDDQRPAILFEGEAGPGFQGEEISKAELARRVAQIASHLRRMGVKAGDRVIAFLPNRPEAVIAFLASASIGAIWSSFPVEVSGKSVLDRAVQIAPKVLFTLTAYRYGGKQHDRSTVVEEILNGLPTIEHCVLVPSPGERPPACSRPMEIFRWNDLLSGDENAELTFEPVAFEHPLWILYSSGTTGIPKPIVQGHGGILLEHLKALSLHLDLCPGDRFFWYTTCGWMMWNFIVSGLLLPGVAIVLFDGSPKYPNFSALWEFAARNQISYFGTSASYLLACMKEGVEPSKSFSFPALRGVGSTGSPLPPEGFDWVYRHVKSDLVLGSISGGTDVCTALVLSNPNAPVYAGRIQCAGLGAKVEAWREDGRSVFGEVGELVVSAPAPSMPIFFWNDGDGSRLRSSYYEKFPGVWSHGDWIEIDAPGGSCVIHGRSDATLNRGGVRMGTADYYSVVEKIPEVAEALVIDLGGLGRDDLLLLFVVPHAGCRLDESLRTKIITCLKKEVSPRHVPDAIHETPALPRTLNGKKLEVPIKRILTGVPLEKAVNRDNLLNPDALSYFIEFARGLSLTKNP